MKEIFTNLIDIIEKSKGVQNVVEEEIKKYYDINKQTLQDAQKNMETKMNDMMKNIPNPGDMAAVLEKMFGVLKDMVGEDNFQKMMEIQNKYPFVKDIFQKIIPMKK